MVALAQQDFSNSTVPKESRTCGQAKALSLRRRKACFFITTKLSMFNKLGVCVSKVQMFGIQTMCK